MKVEDARWAVYNLLFRIDTGNFYQEPQTYGFYFLYENHLTSPFNYYIYGGNISAENPQTIIRVEGDSGDVNVFSRILEQEGIIQKGSTLRTDMEPEALSPKWHLTSQTLNLISPVFGALHASYNSPRLTVGQMWLRIAVYMVMDAAFVAVGGTRFFSEPFNANKNAGLIGAGLAITRVYGAVQNLESVRGHNRLAGLKYTFYLD